MTISIVTNTLVLILIQKHIENKTIVKNIDWNKIKHDGYYGVAFTFKKIKCEDKHFDFVYKRYNFHSTFDVETLIIFDNRAINICTYENVVFK